MPNPTVNFKKLFADLPDAAIIIDSQRKISFFNHAAETLFGEQSAVMLGQPITKLLRGVPPKGSLSTLAGWIGERKALVGCHQNTSDLLLDGLPYLQEGESEWMLLVLHDASTQRALNAEAQRNKDFMKTLLNLANDFVKAGISEIETTIITTLLQVSDYIQADRAYVYTVNTDHQSMSCLYEWCQKGYSPRNSYELQIPVRMLPWLMSQMELHNVIHLQTLTDLPPEAKEEQSFLAKSNVKSWIILPMISVKTLRGFIGFEMLKEEKVFAASLIDVLRFLAELYASALERKRTVDQLRRNQGVHTALISAISETIMQFDSTGTLLSFTIGDEQHFFLSDDFIGKNFADFIPEDITASFSEGIHKALKERTIFSNYFWVDFPDGKQSYDARFVATPDQEIIVILKNTSEQSHEHQLKLDFLLGVAHEMKTPLNNTQLVLDSMEETESDTNAIRNLEIIRKQIHRQQYLMDEILNISRLENDSTMIERKPFKIAPVVEQALEDMQASAALRKVTLVKKLENDLPELCGDPDGVLLIIDNLLTNAIKFSNEGSSVIIQVKKAPNEICLSVSDSGCGIEPAELERLLSKQEPLFSDNEDSTNNRKFGLRIIKKAIENMGGRLEAESVITKGSLFRIYLPTLNA